MTQLAIDLPYRPAFGRADFLVSACNAAAIETIERWPDWTTAALVLHGPPGSGKSHLAELWRARTGGKLIAGEAGASLLVVARAAPAALPIALPGLASRLRATPSVAIDPPDDALLAAVL